MVNKCQDWCGNVRLLSIPLLLVCSSAVFAQEEGSDAAVIEEPGDGSGQITVPLSGTATVKQVNGLSIIPTNIEASLTDIGDSVQKSFTISHTGAVEAPPIEIQDAELFGKSAEDFSSDFNGFQTLYGGDSVDVNVTFEPLSPGDKAAGLRLSIAGATTPYIVLFTGTARYPLTSSIASSDAKLEFGQAVLNSAPKKNFILTNQGETAAPSVNLSAIQLSGTNATDFTVNFTPATLAPGENINISIDMNTADIGIKTAQAKVLHDGHNGAVTIDLSGVVVTPEAVPVNFSVSSLNHGQQITRGTSLQFGPDGRLYVAEMSGNIRVFDVTRHGANNYSANQTEVIGLIKNVPNHNDDGTANGANERLLTGIHVTGSAANPVIYAASSDPRQAAGPSGLDSNLDTNSGILHRLTKNGGWTKLDLVRGLPRSEENHVPNGLTKVGNKIYLNAGGHTNQGVPSNNFAELPEYALSSATLVISLDAIGESTYDLPTLNGPADQYDPFGGHNGLNQAKLTTGGPVQIFASGLRNAYDIVYTESGNFYTWDNGPNGGWGGTPGGNCSDAIDNGGTKYEDGLHRLTQGYYAGHPNPTRGSKNNTFGGQSPIEGAANPEECNFKTPGQNDGSMTTNYPSTNGLAEYTAGNFGGAMKGDLLAAAFNKDIFRVQLKNNGQAVKSKSVLVGDLGSVPLDIIAQGDAGPFPGTIWIVDNIASTVSVLEPSDY